MFKILQSGSSYFIEIRDLRTPEGIVNKIPLIGVPQSPPSDFKYASFGSGWVNVELAEAITGGIYRYTTRKEEPTGYFFTNILCRSAQEAIEHLQLPPTNTAEYKHRPKINPTTAIFGYLPDSEDVQVYIADTSKVEFPESTATNHPIQ